MPRFRIALAVSVVLSVTAWAAACGDGEVPVALPPPDPPRPTTVTVSPATAELAALGATVQLSAQVLDQYGRVMSGATVTWASSDASVATVTASGLVTAAGNGSVTVTATSGTATGSAAVTVVAPVLSPDRPALVAFYEATGGPNWRKADNWLSDRHVGEWLGVTVDNQQRVVRLRLPDNNLVGPLPAVLSHLSEIEQIRLPFNRLSGGIPPELGGLPRLKLLRLDSNDLSGPIPAELGALPELVELALGQNSLSGPIPRELGDLSRLEVLTLGQNDLRGPIPPELGRLSQLRVLHLASSSITGSIPPELGELANLQTMNLGVNELTGPIPGELFSRTTGLQSLHLGYNRLTGGVPAEIGNLTQLKRLLLHENNLTGPLPAEIGGLRNLDRLSLYSNAITGPLPPELWHLTSLEELHLYYNEITGPIPPEFGGMAGLKALLLFGNRLTGPLPPELGDLEALQLLWLADNDLEGGMPPEFGSLTALTRLDVTSNPRLTGPLPAALTQLGQLEALLTGGTELCAPNDESFTSWLGGVWNQRVLRCVGGGGDESPFLLTQAIQSRSFPVPLVAGESALLRVFVTAADAGGATIPPVRASFYADGNEVHVAEIPGQSTVIPAEVREGDLVGSANAEIPGHVLQPGTEIVLEIDPGETLDPGVKITRRIPEEGRLELDIRTMPVLDLTVIPFLWAEDPDSSVLDATAGMAGDPMGHELLEDTRVLLPVGDIDVTDHEAVTVTTNAARDILAATKAIQIMEGGDGFYQGLMAGAVTGALGAATTPGHASFSILSASTMAHELGHNMFLQHAPCGGAGGPDPAFPNPDGSIGSWGYDFSNGLLVPPSANDLMGYCRPRWISGFNFSNALRYRLFNEMPSAARTAAERPVLLLWGGTEPNGQPFLEPTFVLSAPPSLPQAGGDHTLVGTGQDGRELFSLNFAMQEVADSDGRSLFAFALPAQPGWADALAAITLSGPGGSAMLDETTDRPMSILRDPLSGQVRAILRGAPGVAQAAGDQAAAAGMDPGRYEQLLSRGIPGPRAWERR